MGAEELSRRLFPLRLDGRSHLRIPLIVEAAAEIAACSGGLSPVERQALAIQAPSRLPASATEFERGMLVGLCLALVSEPHRAGPDLEAALLAAILEASSCGYVVAGMRLPCDDERLAEDLRQGAGLCTCRAEVEALLAGPLAPSRPTGAARSTGSER
ncbi:hypothetical protein [Methylobacterium nigriterrae]|uniref:hypothetical protein n=1 Tax=Methylobacterium nigriterrae TaxID=3127512 RepID=UPI0030141632